MLLNLIIYYLFTMTLLIRRRLLVVSCNGHFESMSIIVDFNTRSSVFLCSQTQRPSILSLVRRDRKHSKILQRRLRYERAKPQRGVAGERSKITH